MGLFSRKKYVAEESSIPVKNDNKAQDDNTMKWVLIEETKTRKTKDGKEVSYKSRTYKCSRCTYGSVIRTKYCPDCGRKSV